MFTTAKDVETAAGAEVGKEEGPSEEETEPDKAKSTWEFTDATLLQAKRDQIVGALGSKEGVALIRRSRALFWNADHATRGAVTISKRYTGKGRPSYWYAYHPQWRDFLNDAQHGYLVLGCMDREEAFAIPAEKLHPVLSSLHTTEKEDGSLYWHLHLREDSSGALSLTLPKQKDSLQLSPFRMVL